MYYYGYNGAYANNMCAFPASGYYTTGNYGYGAAIILVLFILLVIIFGAGFWNNNPNN